MRIHKKDITQLAILLVLLIGIAFGNRIWNMLVPSAGKYGMAFNKERKKRGILPIPANWDHTDDLRSGDDEEDDRDTKFWTPGKLVYKGDKPEHSMKVVHVLNDRIKYETDFITRQVPGQPSKFEELTINYRYDTSAPWKYSFSSPATEDVPSLITKAAADSILKVWNFQAAAQ